MRDPAETTYPGLHLDECDEREHFEDLEGIRVGLLQRMTRLRDLQIEAAALRHAFQSGGTYLDEAGAVELLEVLRKGAIRSEHLADVNLQVVKVMIKRLEEMPTPASMHTLKVDHAQAQEMLRRSMALAAVGDRERLVFYAAGFACGVWLPVLVGALVLMASQ